GRRLAAGPPVRLDRRPAVEGELDEPALQRGQCVGVSVEFRRRVRHRVTSHPRAPARTITLTDRPAGGRPVRRPRRTIPVTTCRMTTPRSSTSPRFAGLSDRPAPRLLAGPLLDGPVSAACSERTETRDRTGVGSPPTHTPYPFL